MKPSVFDTSSLLALCEAYPPAFKLLMRTEAGKDQIIVPASVLAEVNTTVQMTNSEWEGILLTAGFEVMPLSEHIAIEVGPWPGDVATRHTVYEARQVRGTIVTCRPNNYEGYDFPLTTI